MNNEIKDTVCEYATKNSIKDTVEMFAGIVSMPTIYRWLADVKLSCAYTTEQCLTEWSSFKAKPGNYDSAPRNNRIVLTHQPHFYHIEQELYKDKSIRKRLIANRIKYLFKEKFSDRELLRGFKISGIHIGYSHFSSFWFKKFITDNNITGVYDPCGGWGHRFIGAAASRVPYIYNDKWDLSVKGVKAISKLISVPVTTYNNDCTQFTPQEDYDCVFTCPPYYNVEVYSDAGFKNITEYSEFIRKMFQCSIKPCTSVIGIVINDTFKSIIVNEIGNTFKLTDEIVLGSTRAVSHFNKLTTVKQEVLLVFRRCNNTQMLS